MRAPSQNREDGESSVTERRQVLRGQPSACAVIDADGTGLRIALEVDQHDRQSPTACRYKSRILALMQDEPIDQGVLNAPRFVGADARNDREAGTPLIANLSDTCKEVAVVGIAEGDGNAIGSRRGNADRADLAKTQQTAARVRPAVAEFGRRSQHSLPQGSAHEFRVRKYIRRRTARNAGGPRDFDQIDHR